MRVTKFPEDSRKRKPYLLFVWQESCTKLRMWLARLSAHAAALAQLVESEEAAEPRKQPPPPTRAREARGRALTRESCRACARLCVQNALHLRAEVDREAVDEEVHGIDFLVDSARRLCRGAEKLDRHNTERLRIHVAELIEDVANLRRIDGNQLGQIDKQLRVVAATLRHVRPDA